MSTAKVITNDEKTNEHPMKTTTSVKAPSKSLEVRALIDNAAQRIAPVWPLETFIACNPLQGFEAQSFEEAIAQGVFDERKLHAIVP